MTHDHVLVKSIEKKDDDTGLVDPSQYDDKSEWGMVVKAGPGRRLENGGFDEVCVQEGDIVLFGKFAPYVTRVNGEDYLIIRADEIMSYYRK